MKVNRKHIIYTQADIRRYHEGTMSFRERHALEKAALDDPFLADALEGYTHALDAEAELSHLKNRLAKRTQHGKIRSLIPIKSFSWMRIAALFLIIAGAGWGVYQLTFNNRNDVALSSPSQTEERAEKMQSPRTVDADVLSDISVQGVRDNSVASGNAPKQNGQEQENPSLFKISKNNEVMQQANSPAQKEDSSFVVSQTADAVAQMDSPVKAAQTQTVFEGKVVDAKGVPLPNVSIIANNKQSTLTDLSGNFTLRGTDSVLTATASAVGYLQNQLFLNAPSQNKIVLTEAQNSLEEVVVTGMGQMKGTARKHIVEKGELEGTERWRSFDDYVANNIKVPENLAQKNEGEVRLSFELDKEGTPVNIKVESSLCNLCDEEAVRLLKEGPKWRKGKTKKRKVAIRF